MRRPGPVTDGWRRVSAAAAAAYRRVARPVLFRTGKGDAGDRPSPHPARAVPVSPLAPRAARCSAALRRSHPAPRTVFGVDFPSAVGLAAGMDKDGVALKAWPALGFGFVEVGTVTAHAQPGNPRPRLFRLTESESIVNRMGFNNAGAAALAATLARIGPIGVPLGISLGKSKVTPVEAAVGDYLTSLRAVYRYADYIAVNVSSPNTPGLRNCRTAGRWTNCWRALTDGGRQPGLEPPAAHAGPGAGEDRAGPDRRRHRRAARGVRRPGDRRGDRHQHHHRPGRRHAAARRPWPPRPVGCPAARWPNGRRRWCGS